MSSPEAASEAAPRQTLSLADGLVLVVGMVVGIGIFATPSLVAQFAGDRSSYLLVWLLGGGLTLIGALCYAELASAHPHAGGEHHFLSRAYGRGVALLFAWARCTVIQTGAIALVAFVYGDYAQGIVPLGSYGVAIHAAIIVAVFTDYLFRDEGALKYSMALNAIIMGSLSLLVVWQGLKPYARSYERAVREFAN